MVTPWLNGGCSFEDEGKRGKTSSVYLDLVARLLSERSSYCSSKQSSNGELIRSSCSFISVIWLSVWCFSISNASRKFSWFLFVVKCKGFILLLTVKPCFFVSKCLAKFDLSSWLSLIFLKCSQSF